jgi:hypothetical protein
LIATALGEMTAPASPGERLLVWRHRALAAARTRQREALWQATEREREPMRQVPQRATRRLTGQAQIALRVGQGLNRFRMGQPFWLESTDAALH